MKMYEIDREQLELIVKELEYLNCLILRIFENGVSDKLEIDN